MGLCSEVVRDGILLVDQNHQQILGANPAICDMLGCDESDLISLPFTEFFSRYAIPDTCNSVHDGDNASTDTPQPASNRLDHYSGKETPFRSRNGKTFFVDIVATEIPGPENSGSMVLFRDVTDRCHMRLLLHVQRELEIALKESDNVPGSLLRVLNAILRMPGIDCGGVYLKDHSTGDLLLTCRQGVSQPFTTHAAHWYRNSSDVELIQSGKPVYAKADEMDLSLRAAILEEGIRSVGLIPVEHNGQIVALLTLGSHAHETILPNARDILESMGAMLGVLVATIQHKALLLDTRPQNRVHLDHALDGFVLFDMHGHIREVNSAYCDLVGYTREELLGVHISKIETIQTRQQVVDHIALVHKTGSARFETIQRCKDGHIVDVDASVHSCRIDDEELIFAFLRDIGKYNQMEYALRESEHRYQLVANNVSDVIWTSYFALSDDEKSLLKNSIAKMATIILDRWRFSFASPSTERVFGYTQEEVYSLPIRKVVTPATYANMHKVLYQRLCDVAAGVSNATIQRMYDVEIVCKDGSILWCESASTLICDESGYPSGILGITRDISKRRRMEMALRESESKLRSLFENLPDFVILLDLDANIVFVNRGVGDIKTTGLSHSNGFSFIAPEHREICQAAFQEALQTHSPQAIKARDVFGYWWACRVVPLLDEGVSQHVLVICTDITEQQAVNEAIAKEQRLLRRLLDLHERDRQLTAYDLHDGFVQHLAGALFRLQAFRETLVRDPAAAWEAHETASKLVRKAIDDARRLISGLRPPILDEAGIIEAIDYLVCENRLTDGPDIEFTHNVSFDRLAPPLESAVFRIVQESLRNACRHSRSQTIHIDFTQRGQTLMLKVQDWGVGFDPSRVAEQRFGLQGIRERVRLLGGVISIESAPDQGTVIYVEFPIVLATRETSPEEEEEEEKEAL
jgi:PAS domain S-box-containing protein